MKRIAILSFFALFSGLSCMAVGRPDKVADGAVLQSQAEQNALHLPAFFADHMMLQRNRIIPVWGKGVAGQSVVVQLGGNQQTATVDADGKWRVEMPAMKAGGPYEMTVSCGAASRTITDILVGDVILCSGQSNMELPIRRCMDKVADKVRGYSNSQVRYLKFPHQFDYVDVHDDVRTNGWVSINEQSTAEIGGFCYFLARELQEEQGIPIGIVNSSVGGTKVDAWMRREVLATVSGYDQVLQHEKFSNRDWVNGVRRKEGMAQREWTQKMYQQDTFRVSDFAKPDVQSRMQQVDVFNDIWQHGNGSYWLRNTVRMSSAEAGKTALLRLGAMKDADSVFVNGTFIGTTSYEYPPRMYKVPTGVLHEGENEIVIHLFSYGGFPNLTREKLYQFEVADKVIPVDAEWQVLQGSAMAPQPTSTYFVDTPTGLYNAMIAPLQDFPFCAIAWYQGESDCGQPEGYAQKLGLMIQDWRRQMHYEAPFLCVQIAGFELHHPTPVESGQAAIRNEQRLASLQIPRASLCTAIDIGEWNDIHPQSKDIIGHRAALQMSKMLYGYKGVSEGPRVVSAKREKGGQSVVVNFSKKTGRLQPHEDLNRVFDVLCADGKWVRAAAYVSSPYSVRVMLPAGEVMGVQPRLRYAWDDNPYNALYNAEGLPSSPFEVTVE